MKSNLYLFVIWEKFLDKKELFLEDIKKNFTIREIYEITWNKKEFVNNLKRFYGLVLPDASRKAKMAGNGPFLLILISDPNPKLEKRKLDDMNEVEINKNVYESKMKYRQWVGVDYALHASNSENETEHDLALLFGERIQDFEKQLPEKWDGLIKKNEKQNLAGTNGWKNMREFFNVLNATTNYVVLRSFEELPDKIVHNDIDILTDNVKKLAIIITGENPEMDFPSTVDNKKISIDYRYQVGHHYDEKWAKDVLKRRVMHNDDFYIPNKEDYFYTLLYHTLEKGSKKYEKKLKNIAVEIGIKENMDEILNNVSKSEKFLNDYMTKMGYKKTNIKSRTWYKIKHNEIMRLVRASIYLTKTYGIRFFLKKMKLKFKIMKNHI